MPWTVIVALNDAMTAVIAVVALLVGALAMARGSRGAGTPSSAAAQGQGDTERAPPVLITAPKAVEVEAPQATTFRHGNIRVRGQDSAARLAPERSPTPPEETERIRMRARPEPKDPAAGA